MPDKVKNTFKKNVSIGRRLGAIFYDLLLLITILIFASLVIVIPFKMHPEHTYFFLYQFYVLFVSFIFFAWSWIRGGQTLGMKTWKIKLISNDDSAITWYSCGIRFVVALFSWSLLGIGFLWLLLDQKNRTWYDFASKTQLVRL